MSHVGHSSSRNFDPLKNAIVIRLKRFHGFLRIRRLLHIIPKNANVMNEVHPLH